MKIIRVEKLKNYLSGKWVHKNVNLEINKGETMVIIGGSGAGKSVLLKNICKLMIPTSGEIYMYNNPLSKMNYNELQELRLKLGYVFQGAALFDSMTLYENVGFGLRRHTKLSTKEIYKIVDEKLELVGLSGMGETFPAELSGGMQKRAGIARAIAEEPEIVFYDEPTTGIDSILSDIINDLILKLQEELNITSIVVTHEMKSAYKVGDRIAMLYNGEIIGNGTPDEIVNSDNEYIRQFVTGSSEGPLVFE